MKNILPFVIYLLSCSSVFSQNCVNMYNFDDTDCTMFATSTPVDVATLTGDCLDTYNNAVAVKNAINGCPILNVNFTTINVDCGTYYPAYSGITCNSVQNNGNEFDIDAHLLIGTGFGTVDVIAHELGHAYLINYLDYNLTPPYSSHETYALHEGLSDVIAIYIESKIEGPTDWILGEGTGIVRQLDIDTCYYPRHNAPFSSPHTSGLAIGHLFYLLSDVFGFDNAMQIYVDVIQTMPSDSEFIDFFNALLDEVTANYPNDVDATLAALNEISCISFVCTGVGDEACAEFNNHTNNNGWTFSPECTDGDGGPFVVTASKGGNSTQMIVTLPECDDNDCEFDVEAPTVEIRCNDQNGLACLFVNGQWFHNQSATYMYCPSWVSCYDYSRAGDTVHYTLCEWGTGSNCETGEGCCWDYELVIPDCNADCPEPTVTVECFGNNACLMVNGLAVPNHIWGSSLRTCANTNLRSTLVYDIYLINNPSCRFADVIDLPDCSGSGGRNKIIPHSMFDSKQHQISKDEFKVFPNPAKHEITVAFDAPFDGLYQFIDLSGKIVKSGNIQSSKENIGIDELPDGMYYLILEDLESEGNRMEQKIIKI